MSNKVSALAYSRVAGSPSRKAVLVYIADKASDDGSGIWASKGTIAAETELSLSSVKRIMRDFETEGLIGRRGRRACENGATVEYTIDLGALSDLPEVEAPSTKFRKPESGGEGRWKPATKAQPEPGSQGDRCQGEPGSPCDRSQGEPEPGSQGTPYPVQGEPQTTLEPSFNHGGGSAREQADEPTSVASIREQLLAAMGVDSVSGIIGPNGRQIGTEIDMAIARRWSVELGLTLDQVLTVIAETMARKPDGPPNSFKFFDKPMARFAGELRRLAAEPLNPTDTPKRTKGHSHDRNGTFDQRHDEYLHRLAAGEIDRGPDPSDPWAR